MSEFIEKHVLLISTGYLAACIIIAPVSFWVADLLGRWLDGRMGAENYDDGPGD